MAGSWKCQLASSETLLVEDFYSAKISTFAQGNHSTAACDTHVKFEWWIKPYRCTQAEMPTFMNHILRLYALEVGLKPLQLFWGMSNKKIVKAPKTVYLELTKLGSWCRIILINPSDEVMDTYTAQYWTHNYWRCANRKIADSESISTSISSCVDIALQNLALPIHPPPFGRENAGPIWS
jgi:hypothetical protein